MATACLGQNRDGGACSAAPGADGYCMWHSPANAATRDAWRRKGGAQRSNRARAKKRLIDAGMSASEVGGLLSSVLRGVVTGTVEPGVGNACANIARALVEVRKVSDLEQEVADLERLVRGGSRSG